MEGKTKIVMHPARMEVKYIAVESNWLAEYIQTCLGKIHKCFILAISSYYSKPTFLGCELSDVHNDVEDLLILLIEFTIPVPV